jgi:hypothetical protein
MEPGRSSLMLEFQGPVQTQATTGAVNLVLRGRWRDCDTEVLFAGATPNTVPPTLREVRLMELGTGVATPRQFRLDSTDTRLELRARSVQVHRAVGAALFTAVPPARVPLRLRAGWSLLLSALILRAGGSP